MLTVERLHFGLDEWEAATRQIPDRTFYQSSPWLAFLANTQGGEVVFAAVRDGNSTVGYFAGLVVHKFGLRILGSPFAGWGTSYMGLLLQPGVPRWEALAALRQFAFREMCCVHLEYMDHHLQAQDVDGKVEFTSYAGFEIDLTVGADKLLANMTRQCRQNIRQAEKNGITVEQAHDLGFADDYYAQLEDVFGKQNLIPTYRKQRVQELVRDLGAGDAALFLRARDPEGRCIATNITFGANGLALLWGAASWRHSQILRPNEILMWTMLRHWQQRGMRVLDMGGGGEYKRKYGSREIAYPWLQMSKYAALPFLRNTAASMVRMQQRVRGYWKQAGEARAVGNGDKPPAGNGEKPSGDKEEAKTAGARGAA